jgi:hypothetical protein
MRGLRRLALAACVAVAAGAPAATETAIEANGLRVAQGRVASVGPSAPTAAAYFSVTNAGATADRLVAAESAAARRVEMHAQELVDGVARMIALDDGIDLPPGATVELAQGGLHVMLMGLTEPLSPGDRVALTLVFERAGSVTLDLPVEALGAARHDH